ncbi:DUF4148 domain-containing protein [Caballeronia sp. GACF4]|uniref:DUF4148 domain-containing protein n=1 Tax=Caballeronia sp. GACF4 TaxID=2921763 RepID=UPI002027B0BF|nr:DUF4148 domain-containing protein [Caballeronia sp. GACF4]
MSKFLVSLAFAVSAVAAPAMSYAQSNQPVTRAEVRADLVRLEKAGYKPAVNDDATYPADIQAAEAKVAASYAATHGTSDVGGAALTGASASGSKVSAASRNCVGPADYCVPYFGS